MILSKIFRTLQEQKFIQLRNTTPTNSEIFCPIITSFEVVEKIFPTNDEQNIFIATLVKIKDSIE